MGRTLPLAGLILAQADDGGYSPALLAVAGQTLVEYQARLAWGAGARHIVVMVDHVPPAMVVAFDRLRDEDIPIQIARDAGDAADRIHPDEKMLVFAAGTFAPGQAVGAFAASEEPALLTFAAAEAPPHAERIDAADHWAGLALLSGQDLRDIAAMLGDWALAPTLLRTAVQRGAARKRAGEGVRLISTQAEAAAAISARDAQREGGGPFERHVAGPLAGHAAQKALALAMPFELATVIAPVLLATSLLLAALGWLASGFAVYAVALIAGRAFERLAAIALRRSGLIDWRARIELMTLAGLLLTTGIAADSSGLGWGSIALALWAAINIAAPENEARRWPGEAAMTMLAATAAAWPLIGLGALIAMQLAMRWRHLFKQNAMPEPMAANRELSL